MRKENDIRINDTVKVKGSPDVLWLVIDYSSKTEQFKLGAIGVNNKFFSYQPVSRLILFEARKEETTVYGSAKKEKKTEKVGNYRI